jgi:hypothetical protein
MGIAEKDPTHVRPEAAITGRVRIAVVVRVLVVDAMRGNPEDWPTFKRQRTADGEKVLKRFRRLITAMGMKAVIAEADTETDRQPMQDDGDGKIGPTEKEKCRNRQNMKDHHHNGGDPVQG